MVVELLILESAIWDVKVEGEVNDEVEVDDDVEKYDNINTTKTKKNADPTPNMAVVSRRGMIGTLAKVVVTALVHLEKARGALVVTIKSQIDIIQYLTLLRE